MVGLGILAVGLDRQHGGNGGVLVGPVTALPTLQLEAGGTEHPLQVTKGDDPVRIGEQAGIEPGRLGHGGSPCAARLDGDLGPMSIAEVYSARVGTQNSYCGLPPDQLTFT